MIAIQHQGVFQTLLSRPAKVEPTQFEKEDQFLEFVEKKREQWDRVSDWNARRSEAKMEEFGPLLEIMDSSHRYMTEVEKGRWHKLHLITQKLSQLEVKCASIRIRKRRQLRANPRSAPAAIGI